MKQILVAVCVFANFIAEAQTERGTILPGGSVGFQTTEAITSFYFSPSIGYFVKDNLAIGSSLTLVTTNSSTMWGLGPYIRSYFGKNTKGKPFIGVNTFFLGGGGDTQIGYGANAGYAIFLNPSIALEVAADYFHYSTSYYSLIIGTGFRIHFRRQAAGK